MTQRTSAAEHLAELISCRTVSAADERDEAEFVRFRKTFAGLYPLLHERLELTMIGGSMLFRWPGTSAEKPIVLMAHYDVVPAPAEQWRRDPFEGAVVDGAVWGRGALDDKGHLVAVAEAVEQLLAADVVPAHDVYLSFGDDEEVFGDAAGRVVDHLEQRGVRPWLVNDEGGAVVEGAFPGVKGPTAMIAIVEKGTVDVELVARGAGGHASTPPRDGATARLARAIVRLEENPAPARLSEPVVEMMRHLADLTPAPMGAVLRRADKVNRPMAMLLGRLGPETNAIARTTMAVTRLSGSPASNVLAQEARATVNVRLAVGDSIEQLTARLTSLLEGLDVEIASARGANPPPVSRTDNEAFALLSAVIAEQLDGAAPVPYVQTGGTDSRHFTRISDAVYRFSPFDMTREQRDAIHAADEHLRVDSLERGVAFFRALLTRHA